MRCAHLVNLQIVHLQCTTVIMYDSGNYADRV